VPSVAACGFVESVVKETNIIRDIRNIRG